MFAEQGLHHVFAGAWLVYQVQKLWPGSLSLEVHVRCIRKSVQVLIYLCLDSCHLPGVVHIGGKLGC